MQPPLEADADSNAEVHLWLIRRGLLRVMRREDFDRGCAAAGVRFTRARADDRIRELVKELSAKSADRRRTPGMVLACP